MEPLRFVVTVDDAGLSQDREVEERSIRFFTDHDVPASFFVIPETGEGRPIDADRAWLARARSYEAAGFDYQLHGFRHEGFEFGPPEPWMVRICGADAVASEAEGFAGMRCLWTDDALREKLLKAIDVFGRAFGRRPEGVGPHRRRLPVLAALGPRRTAGAVSAERHGDRAALRGRICLGAEP